jgi:hypothetical protein
MEYLKKIKWDPMDGLPAQLALGFAFGVIGSIFGSEGYIFIIYYIIFELIVLIFSKSHNLFYRLGIVCGALSGWVIGRTVSGADTIWNDI